MLCVTSVNKYNPGRATFSTYITTITKRICIDYLRKKNRIYEASTDPQELADIESWIQHTDTDLHEKIATLEHAIEELPADKRLALKLFYFHKKSYNEIADILGRNYHWVKNTLSNARLHLKKVLLSKKSEE